MRLRNFVIDVQNITPSTGDTKILIDSADPSTRATQNNVYPWGVGQGDTKSPLKIFQGSTQLTGSSFVSVIVSGSVSQTNTLNTHGTMMMTGSLSAPVESDSTYQWGVLMVANSLFEG